MKHTTTVLLEIEVELEVNFICSTPDVLYLPNGDPGYPGEPAEWELLKIGQPIVDIFSLVEGKMGEGKFYDEVLNQVIEEMVEPEPEEEEIF